MVIKNLEAKGELQEESLEDKSYIDPETSKIYESMYQLPPQRFADAEKDWNPGQIENHYGSSWKQIL